MTRRHRKDLKDRLQINRMQKGLQKVRKKNKRRDSRKRKQNIYGFCFLAPSLLGVSLFVLAPFLDVIRRSFYTAVGGRFAGIANYREVLENAAFEKAFFNTLKFLAVCLPLLLCLSFAAAYVIYGMKKFQDIFQASFLVPMAIPVASVVVFWKLIFDSHGTLNHVLCLLGAEGTDWMNTGYAFWILVFSYLWRNMGYDVVLWIAGLSQIPEEIYEAGRVAGAGKWDCFRYVTLPLIKQSFFMTGILSFVNAFRVFREAYLIAGDYPHDSIYMLQHLFNNWFTKLDIQKMSAAAVMLAGGISVLLMAVQVIDQWKEERQ